jgi:trehalose 6-phosphate phosphatase
MKTPVRAHGPVSASLMCKREGDEHRFSDMQLNRPADPPSLPAAASLFLDFDGTLAPLALRPQDVSVAAWVVPTLQSLRQELKGALAIISGRQLLAIDTYLQPLVLAAAGCHGVERRNVSGRIERHESQPPANVVSCAHRLAARHAGLLLESKPSGLALHFRLSPELATICREHLAQALAEVPGAALEWELLDGHCVCELKQRSVSKGRAVRAFLAEVPFADRLPVFVGDDVTDEDGIRAVQAAGGFGIRVGPGRSDARYRLADTDAVAAWLLQAAGEAPSAHSRAGSTP